jgi:hypothetical protein
MLRKKLRTRGFQNASAFAEADARAARFATIASDGGFHPPSAFTIDGASEVRTGTAKRAARSASYIIDFDERKD